MVFSETVMREKLPKEIYKSMKKTINESRTLDISVANVVANAMKDWAIEKGATHFTHWFQPMTGITAEKHDSFISPTSDGSVIMEFSGKELIKGEPDASSFPSGGLRSTFEARGYTAWDPTSYAFIKDGVLCIPTAFYSYGGEVLDKKTPLIRSMDALNEQAMRILKLFGNDDVKHVSSAVGAEQEYFLIDKELYDRRKDLVFTGRTLFGAMPPKGQELDDHYFGVITPRVKAYMRDLDEELWKLGISAKTEHNEAAPSQHELAPIFATTNIATDHNQLTMEIMKKVALNHDLVCLLHEKPFEGVNGSGKHNNWSLSTDKGVNLFEPGKSPYDNAQFLLFICAVIKAVDEYQDLLRISVASAANDHRLGGNEAPPAIISIFLGEELTEVLEAIECENEYLGKKQGYIKIGVNVLPELPKDKTDRNRTSPLAFTGNKFEFRMLGSAFSVSGPNIVMNTIVADALSDFADRLEKAKIFTDELHDLIKETYKNHKRIIFNGNNYLKEWQDEAESRGLLNLKTTADALPYYIKKKNVELFSRHKVFTPTEVESRYEILCENYAKVLNIEAKTFIEMSRQDMLPAVIGYVNELTTSLSLKNSIGKLSCKVETVLAEKFSKLCDELFDKTNELEAIITKAKTIKDPARSIKFYKDKVCTKMASMRSTVDEIEANMSSEYWPYPTYSDLLFSVR